MEENNLSGFIEEFWNDSTYDNWKKTRDIDWFIQKLKTDIEYIDSRQDGLVDIHDVKKLITKLSGGIFKHRKYEGESFS